MKDARLNWRVCSILRLVRGPTCCGVKTTTVRPVSARVQGFAARHFERGNYYD